MQPELNNAVGPGATPEEGIAPKPLLEGASEREYIEILNPLSVDFIAQFGVTRPTRVPLTVRNDPRVSGVTNSEEEVKRNYGLDLRNPNHQGKAQITNKVSIKAGRTVRVLGNEAQVIARQLVNEIMQRRGNKLMLADPYQRNLVEKEIVISRGYLEDVLGNQPQSMQEQFKQKEIEGVEFPDVQGLNKDTISDPRSSEGTGDIGGAERRNPGRPKKTATT